MTKKVYFIDMDFPKLFGGIGKFVATSKARYDVTEIVCSFPKVETRTIIRYYTSRILGTLEFIIKLYFILKNIPKGSTIFLQYPYINLKIFVKVAPWFKKYKTIALVHDLASYRYTGKGTVGQEIYTLNQFDTIIVHSESMKELIQCDGVKSNIVILEAFDYLIKGDQKIMKEKDTVVFAGGLSKSKFLRDLRHMNRDFVKFNLYGNGLPDDIPNEWLSHKGVFTPDVITPIQGEWGLLWEGDSIETCSGNFGNYLKIIAPHKFSLYIACGLKIIAWEGSAMAPLIKENKIGITISKLSEIESKIMSLSIEEIDTMEKNVATLSKKVREGKFLKSVLNKIFV